MQRVLKTDAFDEAVGEGLLSFLRTRARGVASIDFTFDTARHASLAAGTRTIATADVRRLPFADAVFDLVISNSTLDHFRAAGDIETSLAEIHRVLAPGGSLILTMDNSSNPVVALRNALPFRVVHRLGLVPYYVGVTCTATGGERMLNDAAFAVLDRTAILHCPRAPAIAVAAILGRLGADSPRQTFLRAASAFEVLERSKTRYRTGYFNAFLARKRA